MARKLAQLVANAIARRGQPIVLRTAQMTANGPIPPIATNAVLAADLVAGATTLSLSCGSASGQFVAGDIILAGGTKLTVAAPAQATALSANSQPGFADITLTAPYSGATVATGTAVTFAFAADATIIALVGSYPTNVVDGTVIEAFDVRVQIGAWQQAAPDPKTQKLIVNGQVRAIIRVDPVYGPAGELEKWMVQAR